MYGRETLDCYEEAVDEKFKAFWKPLVDFLDDNWPLYPDGLLELLIEKL